MELCFAHAPPKVYASTRHIHPFSPFADISEFWQKFFKTSMCLMGAYAGPPIWGGKTQYLMYLLI